MTTALSTEQTWKLEKEVFKEEIVRLTHFFPNWRINLQDKATMISWYNLFSMYGNQCFRAAVTDYIRHEFSYPTAAGIIKQCVKHNNLISPELSDDYERMISKQYEESNKKSISKNNR